MKSFSNHLRRLHETTTLGNVNPRTGKPEPGVHEYDAQGNKTRSYSGSSAPSNTPPQPEPNLPKPAPNASSETRFTNPEAEQRFRDELDQRLGNTRPAGDTRPPPKPASQEDRLAARFPEAYPEKEVAGQYDKNPETGEYEKTGSAVKDVDPVMTDPNDPKYNEVLDQLSGEEYAGKLRNWVLDRMDPNATVANTLRDFGVSSPGDPPDPTEPEDHIPAPTISRLTDIEDAGKYNKEWERLEGLVRERGRSKDGGMFYESTGVLSFRGFLAEAGIRRKLRVLQAHEKNPTGHALRSRFARLDVQREQNKRTGRVLRRAKAEAEAHVPAPTTGGIHAHVERLGRVGEMAAGFAGQMADAEKPGFIRARERRSLSPRGNDGY